MKAKQIKRSIFAIFLIAVLMVGTSVVGVGAATQKTYLDSMLYTEETNAIKYGVCNLTKFDGGFNNNVAHADCKNALKICMENSDYDYQENADRAMYKVTYQLNNKFDEFFAGLITYTNLASFVNLKVYTDETCVYDANLTSSSDYQNICINVNNTNSLSFVLTAPFAKWGGTSEFIIDNAYLTSEGTTPEPTEKPTQKPTVSPATNPVINPTVAPTTAKPDVTPTKDVEVTTTATKTTTTSEEATSTKIHPTASTNPTSKISTTDTATKDSANKGTAAISNNKGNSDNGTIQTGAISIAVVLFVILASLATGGFVWYRRKIK